MSKLQDQLKEIVKSSKFLREGTFDNDILLGIIEQSVDSLTTLESKKIISGEKHASK
jgi:hypothetical protein